jgi:hypothetical protein
MLRSTTHHRWPRAGTGLAAAVVALSVSTVSDAPLAQTACGNRQAIARLLKENFAEVPTAIGLGRDGRVFEVFSAPEGITWTVVATSPQGQSCILADGRYWSQHATPVPGLESSWRP